MATRSPLRLIDSLAAVAAKDERLIVGLMSGTSHDAVDAALVEVSGTADRRTVNVERFESVPFDPDMRVRIRRAAEARTPELARLHFDIGEAFARAALRVVKTAGREPGEVDLIGSHGQTIYHEPPSRHRAGVTLQIGEGSVIAERTGVVTVSDFRAGDVAAGGSGAPLIPIVDWLLFRRSDRRRLMLNIGGVANVTLLDDDPDEIVAFDTGPGNALMDEIVSTATDGRDSCDRDGALALGGQVCSPVVDRYLRHPYFLKAPPKSTGREVFGPDAARGLARMAGREALDDLDEQGLRDLVATAAMVTARSIWDAAREFAPGADEVVVSGGGVRNRAVMSFLTELFDPVPVGSLEALGMDPDAKEAVGFAVLANETITGTPGNVPAATGARHPAVLGKISSPL